MDGKLGPDTKSIDQSGDVAGGNSKAMTTKYFAGVLARSL